jgi:hypothetical protein
VDVWQLTIQKHHVNRYRRLDHRANGRRSASGFNDSVTPICQRLRDRPAHQRFIVDNEDAERLQWCAHGPQSFDGFLVRRSHAFSNALPRLCPCPVQHNGHVPFHLSLEPCRVYLPLVAAVCGKVREPVNFSRTLSDRFISLA